MHNLYLILRLLPFIVMMIAPLVLTRRYCRRMESVQGDLAAGWFGFQRALQWIWNATWFTWLIGVILLDPWHALAHALGWHPIVAALFHNAMTVLAPAVIVAFSEVMAWPVFQRVRDFDIPHRQAVTDAFLRRLWLTLPATFIWAGLAYSPSDKTQSQLMNLIMLLGPFSLVAIQFLWLRKRVTVTFTPHSLTVGPLRDQAFAMAKKADIELDQIYVFPVAKWKLANAYASEGNKLFLTDWLLRHLSVREINAIIGHELAHMKLRHPAKLAWLYVVLLVGPMAWFRFRNTFPELVWVAFWFLACLKMIGWFTGLISRRYERQADLEGIAVSGDPEAFITGLARLDQLNLMPHEFSRFEEKFVTHPSTMNRLRAVAQKAGITEARLRELMAAPSVEGPPPEPPPTYDLPQSVEAATRGEGPIFDSTVRQTSSHRFTMAFMLIAGVVPFGVAWGLVQLNPEQPEWLLLGFAAVLFVLLLVIVPDWISRRYNVSLRNKIAARVFGSSVPPDATFVGLSPGTAVRTFEGCYNWDLGFLVIRADRIFFLGEQARFALSRAQVRDVRPAPGAPQWFERPRVNVRWSDETAGHSGAFSLAAIDSKPLGNRVPSAALLSSLENWQREDAPPLDASPASPWAELPVPGVEEVTGKPVKLPRLPERVLHCVIVSALPFTFSCLSGLFRESPGAAAATMAASFIGTLLVMFPTWRNQRRYRNAYPEAYPPPPPATWLEYAKAAGLAGAVVLAVCLWLFPLSRLNCIETYYDTDSGRSRSVRYIAFINVRDEVQDQRDSQLWQRLGISPGPPDWRLAFVRSGFGHRHKYTDYSELTLAQSFFGGFMENKAVALPDSEKRKLLLAFTACCKTNPNAAIDMALHGTQVAEQLAAKGLALTNAATLYLDSPSAMLHRKGGN